MKDFLTVDKMAVEGAKVILRLDLNVPLREGIITDDTRIRAALPTLTYLLDHGAAVIACSHLGRPKGKVVPGLSLAPVAQRLDELLPGRRVLMARDVAGPDAVAKASALEAGELLLLENLRFEPGETKGDEGLAASLAAMADLYVNDAFGTIHRPHVSVCALPQRFSSPGVGFLLRKELDYLAGRLGDPEHPYLAILGGAKVSDKIPVLRRLVESVDALCIGGAMAYTFLSARGLSTGRSRIEPGLLPACSEILDRAEERGIRVHLPVDHRAAPSFESPRPVSIEPADSFPAGLVALDIGPRSQELFAGVVESAATLFWNGPMGVFERPPFNTGTVAVCRAVASSPALSVVGGGDSVAAVRSAGLAGQISHISTGGGASLALLAGEALPGLESLAPSPGN